MASWPSSVRRRNGTCCTRAISARAATPRRRSPTEGSTCAPERRCIVLEKWQPCRNGCARAQRDSNSAIAYAVAMIISGQLVSIAGIQPGQVRIVDGLIDAVGPSLGKADYEFPDSCLVFAGMG